MPGGKGRIRLAHLSSVPGTGWNNGRVSAVLRSEPEESDDTQPCSAPRNWSNCSEKSPRANSRRRPAGFRPGCPPPGRAKQQERKVVGRQGAGEAEALHGDAAFGKEEGFLVAVSPSAMMSMERLAAMLRMAVTMAMSSESWGCRGRSCGRSWRRWMGRRLR